jgi:hypothetical protein
VKAIAVMFDSLNRRHLPPYDADEVHAPNFARALVEASVPDLLDGPLAAMAGRLSLVEIAATAIGLLPRTRLADLSDGLLRLAESKASA